MKLLENSDIQHTFSLMLDPNQSTISRHADLRDEEIIYNTTNAVKYITTG